jgi:hypothetical protein
MKLARTPRDSSGLREPEKRPKNLWSWRWDSNPQPADYKSAALPLSYASEKPGENRQNRKRQIPPTGNRRKMNLNI